MVVEVIMFYLSDLFASISASTTIGPLSSKECQKGMDGITALEIHSFIHDIKVPDKIETREQRHGP